MLFQSGHSSLVRLSDCLKMGIGNAFETTKELVAYGIAYEKKYSTELSQLRLIAQRQLENNDYSEETQEELRIVSAQIPAEAAKIGVSLQGRLHAEVLS